ncbi:hypothetical protein AVEN_59594-1 [Araneus ventricosus]|uniref:Reverse transcriptase domain-containing protein n=1 Tax=Araneus ventricosus TaxID=182803 RepID=A0A4Y2N8V4_ARAVE|nr:hypothetical protein AVEN_59594-1 [Araneus ventricosus]
MKNCPRNLFSIISSFLSDRWISFSYGNSSLLHGYNVGCPQGSNSGPLLWLLVVDEALNISFDQSTKALAYADDIYLFVEAHHKNKSTRSTVLIGPLEQKGESFLRP